MLAGHPDLFAPPELQLLNFPTLRDRRRVLASQRDDFWLQGAVRALMGLHGVDVDTATAIMEHYEGENLTVQQFYRRMQVLLHGRMLVDKTPTYALDPTALRRAEEYFHRPRYIHLIRDAGAAIESFLEAKLHVFFPPFFSRSPEMDPRTLAEAVWTVSHENVTAFLAGVDPGRVYTVFYDELVREPAGTMRRISQFLGIPFRPEKVDPYEQDPRTIMTDPVRPLARMLGDVKFRQHGRVRRERADRASERPGGVPLSASTSRLQAQLSARRVRRPSSLVTLRSQGDVPALFLVHPAGGGVDCYQQLVARLWPGPQVHAHRSITDASGSLNRSLVELAASYLGDLRSAQPRGPYRLCGWSFGGVVAFEMAAQLIAAGQDVAFLTLLDTRVHLTGAPPLIATEEDLIGLFLRDHDLDLGGPQCPGRVATALADGRHRGVIPPSLSLGEFVDLAIRYGQAFMENVRLARAYTPTSRVPRLLVIEAADRPIARTGAAQDWTLWADHVMQEQVPATTSRSSGHLTWTPWPGSWRGICACPGG